MKLVNRAKMTITAVASSGTGNLTLGAASAGGFQTFADAGVSNGDIVRYTIEGPNAGDFEIGSGVYTASGTTLSRIPTESSNSNNAITASTNSVVYVTAAAVDIVQFQHAWPLDLGVSNIAIGQSALNANVSGGNENVAVGTEALAANTTYDANVAIGHKALKSNNNTYNTAVGHEALQAATSVRDATAVGTRAQYSSLTDSYNTSVGYRSLYNCNGGTGNTAIGHNAGRSVTTGDFNTLVGYGAAYYSTATLAGSNNTFLGKQPYSNSTYSNRIYLGNSSIVGLYCNDDAISSLSDERDKTDIVDCKFGLSFINDIRPRSFTWNRRDGTMGSAKRLGFIAQEIYETEINHSSTGLTKIVNFDDPSRLTVAPARILPVAIKAIQELSDKIDALEARLVKLET